MDGILAKISVVKSLNNAPQMNKSKIWNDGEVHPDWKDGIIACISL